MPRLDDDDEMERRIRGALERRYTPATAEGAGLDKMGGHASMRVYWRVDVADAAQSPESTAGAPGCRTLVAMVLADRGEALTSAEGPPGEDLPVDTLPFVDVQQFLSDLGLPVPSIESVDLELGVLLLEDLGDETFEDVYEEATTPTSPDEDGSDNSDAARLYTGAIDLLVDAQRAFVDADSDSHDGPKACICWRRRFDRDTLGWELDHYLEWGLEARRDRPLAENQRRELEAHFDHLVDALLDLPSLPVFRDYQSRNLMYSERTEHADPWVLIDFQDALIGPYIYDLVALLRDSYVELAPSFVSRMVEYYVESGRSADLRWCDREQSVFRAFHLQTVQRKLKDAGRFVYLDRETDNPAFMQYYDRSVRYADRALRALDGWRDLRRHLREAEPALG